VHRIAGRTAVLVSAPLHRIFHRISAWGLSLLIQSIFNIGFDLRMSGDFFLPGHIFQAFPDMS
jgi:hypothetical protein